MKRFIPYLLAAAAVLVGLLLPAMVSHAQDSRAEQLEAGEIRQVNLAVESGLSVVEKMGLLADSDIGTLDVGVGQYQSVTSLSKASWTVLEQIITNYGVQILDTTTAQQVEQHAVLISKTDKAFIYWEVLFQDGNGTLLKLYLDDETAKPLAMAYETSEERAEMLTAANEDWHAAAIWALCDINGVVLGEVEDAQETYYNEAKGEVESVGYNLPVGDGETWAYIDVEFGTNWFYLNKTNID